MTGKITEKKPRIRTAKKVQSPAASKIKPPVFKKPAVKLTYMYAVGKRKSAVARVRLYKKDNRGLIQVNNKDYKEYFPSFEFQKIIEQPLKQTNLLGKHLITIKVLGGGTRGQAEAIKHGLGRLLLKYDEDFRKS